MDWSHKYVLKLQLCTKLYKICTKIVSCVHFPKEWCYEPDMFFFLNIYIVG